MEVTRLQMNGHATGESYPPRFKKGDMVICLEDNGLERKIVKGRLYIIGKDTRNDIAFVSSRSGRWDSKTKLYLSHLSGAPVDGCSPWNYRFDLVESVDEESCMVCSSNCKREETCGFFDSMIKGEENVSS